MQAKATEIGIDWLTLTTKDTARWQDWRGAFEFVAAEEKARGHKWADAHLLGYVGESCGHAFIGKRVDGFMCRLTSSAADRYGPLFEPDAVHCTRIDLQVTVEMPLPSPDMLTKAYEHARIQKVLNGRPPVYSLLKSSAGGSTLYVGSRSSARYGRIYDKGAENGDTTPGKLWRYELEVKDVLADQAVAMLAGAVSVERQIYGILGAFFADRSIPVPWTVPSLDENFKIPRIPVEDAGSLRWLAGPVAKTVARLVDSVGAEATLRALMASCCNESSDTDIIASMADVLDAGRRVEIGKSWTRQDTNASEGQVTHGTRVH